MIYTDMVRLTSSDLRKAVRKLRNQFQDPNYQVVVHPDFEKELLTEILSTADAMDSIKMDQEMRTAVERWKKKLNV